MGRFCSNIVSGWRTGCSSSGGLGTLTARSCLLVSHARDEGAHLLALTSHGQLLLGA